MSTYQHDPRMGALVGARASTAQSRWSRHYTDPKSDPKQQEGLGRCLGACRPRRPNHTILQGSNIFIVATQKSGEVFPPPEANTLF